MTLPISPASVVFAITAAAKSAGVTLPSQPTVTVDGAEIRIHFDKPKLTTIAVLTPKRTIESVAEIAVERVMRVAEKAADEAGRIKIPPLFRVKSSSISEIGHADGALFVRFAAGSLYRYPDVSLDTYNAVRNAKSVGRTLQLEVLAKHQGVVVSEPDGA
jgi:hypothetical protein